MELIRSTTEMEPSREPRSEAIPPHTRIHLRIRTCNTITMEVTEAAESPSEKEEEHFCLPDEKLKVRHEHLLSFCIACTLFIRQ